MHPAKVHEDSEEGKNNTHIHKHREKLLCPYFCFSKPWLQDSGIFYVDSLILTALFISIIQLLACAACSHSSVASFAPSGAIMEMCVMTNSAIL